MLDSGCSAADEFFGSVSAGESLVLFTPLVVAESLAWLFEKELVPSFPSLFRAELADLPALVFAVLDSCGPPLRFARADLSALLPETELPEAELPDDRCALLFGVLPDLGALPAGRLPDLGAPLCEAGLVDSRALLVVVERGDCPGLLAGEPNERAAPILTPTDAESENKACVPPS